MSQRGGMWWAGLVALAVTACGGDGGNSDNTADTAQPLVPGSTYEQVAELPDGHTIVSQYVTYGVTTGGELLASPRADLIANRLVPLLVSETRDGQPAAEAAAPAALLQQQQAFFKQAWDAYAALYPAYSPADIAREMADLDGRIVDLMDDAAASGISLDAYLQLFEQADQLPEFKDLAYTELMLQQALTEGVKGSTLDDSPAACAAGAERVVSVSGLSWYCQPAQAKAAATARASTVSNPLSFQERIRFFRDDERRHERMANALKARMEDARARIESLELELAQLKNQLAAALHESTDLYKKLWSLREERQRCRTPPPGEECSVPTAAALEKEIATLEQRLAENLRTEGRLRSQMDRDRMEVMKLQAQTHKSQLELDRVNAQQTEIQNAISRWLGQQATCRAAAYASLLPPLYQQLDCR